MPEVLECIYCGNIDFFIIPYGIMCQDCCKVYNLEEIIELQTKYLENQKKIQEKEKEYKK